MAPVSPCSMAERIRVTSLMASRDGNHSRSQPPFAGVAMDEPEATLLANSFDEVSRRIAERGRHTAPFAAVADPRTMVSGGPVQMHMSLTRA